MVRNCLGNQNITGLLAATSYHDLATARLDITIMWLSSVCTRRFALSYLTCLMAPCNIVHTADTPLRLCAIAIVVPDSGRLHGR